MKITRIRHRKQTTIPNTRQTLNTKHLLSNRNNHLIPHKNWSDTLQNGIKIVLLKNRVFYDFLTCDGDKVIIDLFISKIDTY